MSGGFSLTITGILIFQEESGSLLIGTVPETAAAGEAAARVRLIFCSLLSSKKSNEFYAKNNSYPNTEPECCGPGSFDNENRLAIQHFIVLTGPIMGQGFIERTEPVNETGFFRVNEFRSFNTRMELRNRKGKSPANYREEYDNQRKEKNRHQKHPQSLFAFAGSRVGGRRQNGIIRTACFAKPALTAIAWCNGNPPESQFSADRHKGTIRTEEAAVRTGNEYSGQKNQDTPDEYGSPAGPAAKQGNNRIVTADNKRESAAGEEDRQPKYDISRQAEYLFENRRDLNRFERYQFL